MENRQKAPSPEEAAGRTWKNGDIREEAFLEFRTKEKGIFKEIAEVEFLLLVFQPLEVKMPVFPG